ncbi:MAG: hypothetical protein M0P11_03140 [Anaerolineaceae bacterium]|nr:hypothetical protein [Anaerolineaceae bacterium]
MIPNRNLTSIFFAILIILSVFSFLPSQASAADELIFTVDSTLDQVDFAANSVCSVGQPTGGPCTLRAAISEANANIHHSAVTILVPPGLYKLTIPPSLPDSNNHGDLNINATTSTNLITIKAIQKGTVTITPDTGLNDRILEVGWNSNVAIRGINFTGAALILGPSETGGGAILNFGNLTLEGTVFQDNSVVCVPAGGCENNLNGGAILNYDNLSIKDSSFIHNTAERGWAIFNAGGPSICNITHSSFTQNTGVIGTITNYATLSMTNSTMSGNFASSWMAGIVNDGLGQLYLQSCTLANIGDLSSIFNTATVNVGDNIFAAQPEMNNFYSIEGTWNSLGYNIFSDASWPAALSAGDLLNTNPMLGNLGTYGGATLTHSLLRGSPAVNHRPGRCFTILYPIEDDQRHQARVDGSCDSGAFELGHFYLPVILR